MIEVAPWIRVSSLEGIITPHQGHRLQIYLVYPVWMLGVELSLIGTIPWVESTIQPVPGPWRPPLAALPAAAGWVCTSAGGSSWRKHPRRRRWRNGCEGGRPSVRVGLTRTDEAASEEEHSVVWSANRCWRGRACPASSTAGHVASFRNIPCIPLLVILKRALKHAYYPVWNGVM